MMRSTTKKETCLSIKRGNSSSPSLFFRLVLVLSTGLGVTIQHNVNGFSSSFSASHNTLASSLLSSSSTFQSRLGAADRDSSIDEDEDDRERELAKVRRGRRGRYSEGEDDEKFETDHRGSQSGDGVMDAADMLEDEGFFNDLEDDYDYDDEDYDIDDEDDSYDMFSNTVIPNPILDSIDPDGSADRFPELAADPRFWFDMFLFIAFLNFISFIGPRNPFPEMIPAMYTAGLPPPGM